MRYILPWTLLITTWGANINDLIRGEWFYHTTTQVVFMNLLGVFSLVIILYYYNANKENKGVGKPVHLLKKGGKKK